MGIPKACWGYGELYGPVCWTGAVCPYVIGWFSLGGLGGLGFEMGGLTASAPGPKIKSEESN